MSNTISVTRALAELKLLDARIEKAISEIKPTVCVSKKMNFNTDKNAFNSQAMAKYQSLNDLISRREKMKSAIMKSNSVTVVKIGTKEMTVCEAIEMKNSIRYKQQLLDMFRRQRNQVTMEFENHKQNVKKMIDSNISQLCNRDVKPDPSTIQDLTDMLWKNDPVEVYDPLNLDKEIESLTNEIEDFQKNVDFVLSECNALTKISFD